jgi:hypothetical protein
MVMIAAVMAAMAQWEELAMNRDSLVKRQKRRILVLVFNPMRAQER